MNLWNGPGSRHNGPSAALRLSSRNSLLSRSRALHLARSDNFQDHSQFITGSEALIEVPLPLELFGGCYQDRSQARFVAGVATIRNHVELRFRPRGIQTHGC